MTCGTIQLGFTIDLFSKTVTTNKAGQTVDHWVYERTMPCAFMPTRAEERLVGRLQNPVAYLFSITGHETVDVSQQLRNLKDRSGNIIEDGPFNIIGVRAVAGWRSVDHYTLSAQAVLE